MSLTLNQKWGSAAKLHRFGFARN